MYRIYADDILFFDDAFQSQPEIQLIDVKLTMEVNKAGSLEFTLPTHNIVYNTLQKLKTTIFVRCDNVLVWEGRILHDEKDFYNRKKVYCEGALSYLLDAIVRPYTFKGPLSNYFNTLVAWQRDFVEPNRSIRGIGSDFEDENSYIVRSNSDYTTVLDEITDKILNTIGGYLRLELVGTWGSDKRLRLSSSSGDISNQVIEFGRNLLDIEEYITAENVFTILIPVGAKSETEDGSEGERLTIKTVNGGNDYIVNDTAVALFGKIWKTQTWDDVTEPSNLLTKGRKFLNDNIAMSVTLSINAVDLHYIDVNTENIKVGSQVRVVSRPHGLDTYFLCSKVIIDMQNPDKTEFTLGTGFSALTDKQVQSSKQTNNAYNAAQSASNSVSNVAVNVAGNYVSKSEFASYQSQVNSNFTAVTEKFTAVFHYKGTVDSQANLPTTGNVTGDVWNVSDTGANFAWNGSEWDKLSETTIDLSGYVKTETFNALVKRVEELEKA
jgi:phage minor structural protein